jgi:hypothetical protein
MAKYSEAAKEKAKKAFHFRDKSRDLRPELE